jgi:cbb3-type cytochrome oxidase subunit 1
VLVMFVDLMTAGLFQGFEWRNLAPWENSITSSVPFWQLRMVTGIMMLTGQLFFIYNVLMTAVHRRSLASDPTPEPGASTAPAMA